jgi:hypothetical protein
VCVCVCMYVCTYYICMCIYTHILRVPSSSLQQTSNFYSQYPFSHKPILINVPSPNVPDFSLSSPSMIAWSEIVFFESVLSYNRLTTDSSVTSVRAEQCLNFTASACSRRLAFRQCMWNQESPHQLCLT